MLQTNGTNENFMNLIHKKRKIIYKNNQRLCALLEINKYTHIHIFKRKKYNSF